MTVYFDILHFYYLPQYLPLWKTLEDKGVECLFILYKEEDVLPILKTFVNEHNLPHAWVDGTEGALKYYLNNKPDWVVFGNKFDYAEQLTGKVKSAMMQHGIGPKACYYDVSESPMTVRFVEGEHRLKRLKERFPDKEFIDSGYAKLDPIVNGTIEPFDIARHGLDPNKQTLLYAPTFYPSSIEMLPKNFPELIEHYNLIIKPHFFSFTKPQYQKQRDLLNIWQSYQNVYVAEPSQVSILPFMACADVLFSEASSTLFEFTALNKPAIWCDFYKLRWSYRGPLKFRFTKRLDKDIHLFGEIAERTQNVKQLLSAIETHIKRPELLEKERQHWTQLLTGKVDGQCSQRIAEYLLSH